MADQPPRHVTRRELLALSPLLLLGGFAIPAWRDRLLEAGVAWSDMASGLVFRRDHVAASYPEADVVPFEQFPYNGYDVLEPAIDFEHWALTVGGAVARPGQYTLAQIQTLPKTTHNTRHVCVEGWDVIGRFGGARLRDFLSMVGAEPAARFRPSLAQTITTSPSISRPRSIRNRSCVTRCTVIRSIEGTALHFD
jgi:DMSO/TMAO reductase YedYZ molybdopterin-dependent catalytic subunit